MTQFGEIKVYNKIIILKYIIFLKEILIKNEQSTIEVQFVRKRQ